MTRWMTPEVMMKKRKRKKILFYLSLPLIGALIGGIITLIVASM